MWTFKEHIAREGVQQVAAQTGVIHRYGRARSERILENLLRFEIDVCITHNFYSVLALL